jgi:hypothetical protein
VDTTEVLQLFLPSVTPYLTGFVDDVEGALFFRKFSVPFWALAKVFEKTPMYWYRMEQHITGWNHDS